MRAWDLPTRLFHWALVALRAFAWMSYHYSEALNDPTLKLSPLERPRHPGADRVPSAVGGVRLVDVAVLGLVLVAVDGGRLRASPAAGQTPLYLGHNPLGSYMIVALLFAVAAQAVLGLFTVEHNDVTAGPLYRLVSDERRKVISHWHSWLFYWVILVLVASTSSPTFCTASPRRSR